MSSDYFDAFVREGEEQIRELNNALLALEDDPGDEATMDDIFRSAHTLKGNFAAMGFEDASDLAHAIEDMLDEMREGNMDVTADRMDLVFEGVDELEVILDEIEDGGDHSVDPSALVAELRDAIDDEGDDASETPGTTDGSSDAADVSEGLDAQATKGVLTVVDSPGRLVAARSTVYHVRVGIKDRGMESTDGMMALQGVSQFDLRAAHPPENRIEDGEYDGSFDLFVAGGSPAEIESGLTGQQPVDAVAIRDASEEVAALDADPVETGAAGPAAGEDTATGDTATEDATADADGDGHPPAGGDQGAGATEAALAAVGDAAPIAAHDGSVYHAHVTVEGGDATDGLMALQGVSRFDLLAAHPPEDEIEGGDYDDAFDLFVAGGSPTEIESGLAGQQSVDAVEIHDVSGEVAALDAGAEADAGTGTAPVTTGESGATTPETADPGGAGTPTDAETAENREGTAATAGSEATADPSPDDPAEAVTANGAAATNGEAGSTAGPSAGASANGHAEGGAFARVRGAFGGVVAAIRGAFGGASNGTADAGATADGPTATGSAGATATGGTTAASGSTVAAPDADDTETPATTVDAGGNGAGASPASLDTGGSVAPDPGDAAATPEAGGNGTATASEGETATADAAETGTDDGTESEVGTGIGGVVEETEDDDEWTWDDGDDADGTEDATDADPDPEPYPDDDGSDDDAPEFDPDPDPDPDGDGGGGGDPGDDDSDAGGSTDDVTSSIDDIKSVRVDVDQLDDLYGQVEQLVTSRIKLRKALEEADVDVEKDLDELDKTTSSLQDTVMDMRLVPMKKVVGKFPRVVRDLSREQGKEIDFEMKGTDVELDRTILDRLSDPLIHILRNAVDHGIEPPEEREAAGKDPEGSIVLEARRERDRAIIEVRDDGGGLDAEEIRNKAYQQEIRSSEELEQMDDDDVYDLVFHPGFSTTEEVTDVSGRGVGMDVVHNTVTRLDGSVDVDSDPGEGTTVTLELPVSIAIVKVLFVEAGDHQFGIPIKKIDKVSRYGGAQSVNGQEMIERNDELYKIIHLHDALDTVVENGDANLEAGDEEEADEGMLIRVRGDERRVALYCDAVSDQEEVVVKPLEGVLSGTPGLSGTAVLGEGNVVPVLDVKTI